MNRVTEAVARMDTKLQERLKAGLITEAQITAMGKSLDLNLEEFAHFQNVKSLATVSGDLTAEEGMSVYSCLGGTPSVFNKQRPAVKYVLTQLFAELMKKRIAA